MEVDSNIKLILHKLQQLYSQINTQYSIDMCLLHSNQSLLNYIVGVLQQFQQYISHTFDQRYRPTDEYYRLQATLQNKQAEIRNYVRLQQCTKITQQNLQLKISTLEANNQIYKQENHELRKQCERLKKQLYSITETENKKCTKAKAKKKTSLSICRNDKPLARKNMI